MAHVAGHVADVRLTITVKVAQNDTEQLLCTFDPTTMGFTTLPQTKYEVLVSDGGNACGMVRIEGDGKVYITDATFYSNSLAAGNTFYVHPTYNAYKPDLMIDSFCNKFY